MSEGPLHRGRTRWTVQMCIDLINSRNEAKLLQYSDDCLMQLRKMVIKSVLCLEDEKAKVLWDIASGKKCPWNGANKPDMSVLDKVKKKWFIIEGTVCLPWTIPARIMFKRDKYADLRIGVKSLYFGHKVSSLEVIFDFLAAYSTHLENELT